jgi:subtilase family serine protease
VPGAAAPGSSIVVSDTNANQGAGPASASTTAFYLSANFTLDAADVLLGVRTVTALAANASDSAPTSFVLPAGTATGTYCVIARADANGAVTEASESNNLRTSAPLRVGPDLIVSASTASGFAGAGSAIRVGATTKNQGAGIAGESSTGFYLSSSYTLSAAAIFLGGRTIAPLAGGAIDTGTASVIVPASVATGSYYVIAVADSNGQVAEASETNNTGPGALVRIGPDLVVSALSVPFSVTAGTTAAVSGTVLNQGGGTAPASTTKFFLSTDLVLDAADVLVATRIEGALSAGQGSAGPVTLTIPAALAPRGYWLIVVADADGTVGEAIESNNTRAASVQVKAGT